MINTSCKYCIFKEMDGNTQIGCQLHRIAKFKEQGTKVQKEQSDNIGYMIIEGRYCTALRTEAWAKEQENISKSLAGEIGIQCDIIILIDKNDDIDFEDIQSTIDSAINQQPKAQSIHVVNWSPDIKNSNIVKYFNEHLPDDITYYVDDIRLKDSMTRLRAIDIAADKCDSMFYAIFNAGFKIPDTFLANINTALNDKLERFCVLEPTKEGNGLVVLKKVHDLFMGNRLITLEQYDDGEMVGDELVEKVKFIAAEQKQEYMVKRVTDICKRM